MLRVQIIKDPAASLQLIANNRLRGVHVISHVCSFWPITADFLKVRSHDPEEAIRHDVIVTIINAGKKDLILVNDQLLGFVRERTLDKRV